MAKHRYIIYIVFWFLAGFAAAQESVSLTTSDAMRIAASLWKPEASQQTGAVILIHQGGSDRKEWGDLPEALRDLGYVVLAYDIRGHGDSDKVDSIPSLFNDPNQAPRDLDAAIAFLKTQPQVDPERIGVIGSSIGANLACMASAQKTIKTAISISSKTSAVLNLARIGDVSELLLKSVFHISSKGDQDGERARWAKELYLKTRMPRQIRLVEGQAHGVAILDADAGLRASVYGWLRQNL